MKVGDLVRYTRKCKDLQDLIGLVVQTSNDRFSYGQVRVLWSDHPESVWDWISQLRIVNDEI